MNTDRQPQQPPTRDDCCQIAPESARPATLAGEGLVKAPGRDGDIFLKRGTPVEVERPSPVSTEAPSPRLPGPDGRCPPLAPIRIAAPHEAAR